MTVIDQTVAADRAPLEQASSALTAHAVHVSDRLVVDRSRYTRVVSTAPFCYREGEGYVVIFRYGVVVFVGLSVDEEKLSLAHILNDMPALGPFEEERVGLEIRAGGEEGAAANGVFQVRELSLAHVLVLGDVLAKSVALARYEREIAAVFDTIEPEASRLAVSGKLPKSRKALLRLIGSALLAQHRVSGRIAFAEKPDVLWDNPELGRLFARLEDEYEIIERGTLLNGKVSVVGSAAETFTDMMDTARSARLELLIVILILAELVIAAVTLFRP
ncbi:MAG TPA: RMD1 family protein [Rhizomicrobium sp.]|nr:RMD1 family protein [Rhizomicrobium sp.]